MPESALTVGGSVTTGLIGLPIAHSLSPAMHNAAFRACGLLEQYALWPTTEGQLGAQVSQLRHPTIRGANVTIPYKRAVLDLIDELDPVAEVIGAVNTIVRQPDGTLRGFNTDSPGFIAALHTLQFEPLSSKVVLLGAGGAARGVAHGLILHGASRLTVVNRTPAHAEALLADLLAAMPHDPELFAMGLNEPELPGVMQEATLLINATPVGRDDAALPLPVSLLHPGLLVCDLLYRTTPLLHAAQAAGAQTQNGLEMLVQQAALAFTAWTGFAAPLEVMRVAAQHAYDKAGA